MPHSQQPRSVAFAGQVGERDTETIFGLRGRVSSMEVIEQELPGFRKPTRTVTSFKPDGNRIEHVVDEKAAGVWQIKSRYQYGYDERGARSGPRYYMAVRNSVEPAGLVLDHSLEFEYEENRIRRSLQRQYGADGVLQFTQHFSYNANGERVAIEWRLPDQAVFRTYRFGYSAHGGFLLRKLRSTGRNGAFEYMDLQLTGNRLAIGLRLGRWSLPALTIQLKFAADRCGNHTRSIALRLYCVKRIIPLVALVVRVRRLAYYDPV